MTKTLTLPVGCGVWTCHLGTVSWALTGEHGRWAVRPCDSPWARPGGVEQLPGAGSLSCPSPRLEAGTSALCLCPNQEASRHQAGPGEGPGTVENPPGERRAGSCRAEAALPRGPSCPSLVRRPSSWNLGTTPTGHSSRSGTRARDLREEAPGADLGCHPWGPGLRLSGHTGARRMADAGDTVRRLLRAFGRSSAAVTAQAQGAGATLQMPN